MLASHLCDKQRGPEEDDDEGEEELPGAADDLVGFVLVPHTHVLSPDFQHRHEAKVPADKQVEENEYQDVQVNSLQDVEVPSHFFFLRLASHPVG
jgi:hypothetical protein